MNTELTELVFILDRSGSMGGLESDTIGGFNGMIAKQKAQGKKVNVTTILFDDEVDIIHDRFPVEIIEPLTEKEYFVRGCTHYRRIRKFQRAIYTRADQAKNRSKKRMWMGIPVPGRQY